MKTYIAIDLKSYYASVECVARGLDPLTTNLVVADVSRTDKTICLAVSPSLKSYGISGRARLFEVYQRLREVNAERRYKSGGRLNGHSSSDIMLRQHPDWEVEFIAALPRMAHYISVSAKIYSIYLRFVSSEDIHVYSIDEVFIDATSYLSAYNITARQLAERMINAVLDETGITATAGIGTNLYLCKVAMDIVAKHVEPDERGVRIAELDEMSYREKLWNHKPLTAFWRIGHGISSKLAMYGIDTMGKLARVSLEHEDLLYHIFGVNAELIIDHAWGWEPCTMKEIKAYRPETNSLSSGQVLTCPYTYDKTLVVMKEMADGLAMDMLDKHVVTNQLTITIGYDSESLRHEEIMEKYEGPVSTDYYGRQVPRHAHGTVNIKDFTSSSAVIMEHAEQLFCRIVNPELLIRRLNITANRIISEVQMIIDSRPQPVQLDLFVDYEEEQRKKQQKDEALKKERRVQEAILDIKHRYGKNAILRGLNFAEGATQRDRNKQIGGHKA